jgi:hypothetical protein
MLGIILSVAILTTNAEALPEPKVTITYSLKTDDGGAYWQDIRNTPLGAGDVEFVFDTVDSMNPRVNVTRATPLAVTIEYTADSPGGNIVDGPVELTQTDFGRDFILTTSFLGLEAVVTTLIDTVLSQKGTGDLIIDAGGEEGTITWDNVTAPYEETVVGTSDCVGDLCNVGEPPPVWPRDLDATDRPVVLPTFTVFKNTVFGDEFASDNGTPGDPTDDIDRPDPETSSTVTDTWYGVEVVPEPSGEMLLLAGVLGLAGLSRLRERGGAAALFASLFASRH